MWEWQHKFHIWTQESEKLMWLRRAYLLACTSIQRGGRWGWSWRRGQQTAGSLPLHTTCKSQLKSLSLTFQWQYQTAEKQAFKNYGGKTIEQWELNKLTHNKKRPDDEDARTKLKTQGQESRRKNHEIPTKKEEKGQEKQGTRFSNYANSYGHGSRKNTPEEKKWNRNLKERYR